MSEHEVKEIWKYPLQITDSQIISTPLYELLTVQLQGVIPMLWLIVDPASEPMNLEILCYGTGHGYPSGDDRYLGTVQLNGFVWHYFAAARSGEPR